MCGITGLLSSESIIESDILAMCNALRHRGPDAQNIFIHENKRMAFGHTRLSVIDLSATANQPFFSADKRFVVIFNGEIYNFKVIRKTLSEHYGVEFRTNSDTETVVEAFQVWGKEMVHKFQGMFSIALYDQREKKLFLLRDRIGKKPLFYFLSGKLFVFGSEIKALLKHPAVKSVLTINKNVIPTFLHLGYIPEPATIYQEIFKFPSGHWGEIDSGMKLSLTPYWKIQEQLGNQQITSVKVAKTKLISLLNQSVEERLVSDVPVGAFLSGGTDSSLITAIATQYVSSPLKTFSIGFKESKFDERHYAARVSAILGTDHLEYVLRESEALEVLESYLQHFDEPFADTSAIPTMLVSKLSRNEVTVALTGDGGDELFYGYGAYLWADRLAGFGWNILKSALSAIFAASGSSKWLRIAHLLKPVGDKNIRSHIFSQEQYFFSQREILEKILVEPQHFKPFVYDDINNSRILTPGEQQSLFDFQYYLKDDLLVKVDRASMYYGLECRSPLLDYRIVEFAFSLHPNLKRREGKSKWLLKEILRQYLPDQLIDRPKWGFSIPLASWLSGDLNYLIKNFLRRESIEEVGLFRADSVQKLVSNFEKGHNYLYHRIWVLIILHKWLIEHRSCVQ